MPSDQLAAEARAITEHLVAPDGLPIDATVVVHMKTSGMRIAGRLERVTPAILVFTTLEGRGRRLIAPSEIAQVEVTQ